MQDKVPPPKGTVVTDPLIVSQPQPPVDALHRPFVGNETIDDNLRENVRVAIFNVLGDRVHGLEIAVSAGVATVTGPVLDRAEAARVVKAALSIAGISDVVDKLRPEAAGPKTARSPGTRTGNAAKAGPMRLVSLTRFCGLDDASTGAAIRQAVGRLEHFFTERKLPLPNTLIIIYRNLIPGAITLELGFPVPAHGSPNLEGEFHLTELPVASEQAATAAPGLAPITSTLRELMRDGHAYAWQVLDAEDFRPWRGHPALPLNIGVAS